MNDLDFKNNYEFSQYIMDNYSCSYFSRKNINLFKIEKNYISFEKETETEEFSKIYRYLKKNYTCYIAETPSNGISILKQNVNKNCWQYIVRKQKTQIEMIISVYNHNIPLNLGQYVYARFIIGNIKKDNVKKVFGRLAFNILIKEFKDDGIDLFEKYGGTKGLEIKQQIEKPLIELGPDGKLDTEYDNVHHLDLNSAYAANICRFCPDLYDTYKRIYDKRHEKPVYKDVLNESIGYMQSMYCTYNGNPYGLAYLSKIAINGCRNDIIKLTRKLIKNGNKILLFNTDGIWYQGPIYHDKYEGTDLGQWKNDHQNCKFRMKSKGAYEYIENNKYTPVIRGTSSYEKIKPKDQWEWGDIYKGQINEYIWNDERGLEKCQQ